MLEYRKSISARRIRAADGSSVSVAVVQCVCSMRERAHIFNPDNLVWARCRDSLAYVERAALSVDGVSARVVERAHPERSSNYCEMGGLVVVWAASDDLVARALSRYSDHIEFKDVSEDAGDDNFILDIWTKTQRLPQSGDWQIVWSDGCYREMVTVGKSHSFQYHVRLGDRDHDRPHVIVCHEYRNDEVDRVYLDECVPESADNQDIDPMPTKRSGTRKCGKDEILEWLASTDENGVTNWQKCRNAWEMVKTVGH